LRGGSRPPRQCGRPGGRRVRCRAGLTERLPSREPGLFSPHSAAEPCRTPRRSAEKYGHRSDERAMPGSGRTLWWCPPRHAPRPSPCELAPRRRETSARTRTAGNPLKPTSPGEIRCGRLRHRASSVSAAQAPWDRGRRWRPRGQDQRSPATGMVRPCPSTSWGDRCGRIPQDADLYDARAE
jgi:hypothetical protein